MPGAPSLPRSCFCGKGGRAEIIGRATSFTGIISLLPASGSTIGVTVE